MTLPSADPDTYRVVREFLIASNFDTEHVRSRLGVQHDFQYLNLLPGALPRPGIGDHLDLLIRLFIAGEFVPTLKLPPAVLDAMRTAGLIEEQDGRTFCPVALYPTQGLYVASDRWANPDLSPIHASDDVVYPAITPQTIEFMSSLPSTRCERFLELCSGTGIAALHAAKNYARHAWAFDITARCEEFAEFNRRLNGLENVTVGRGDLYQPAAGATFDRIVAHPPYVPVLEQRKIFSDAGDTGELITRRVFEELDSRLEPGGQLYLMATGIERSGEPYEQRVRQWVGNQDHDIAIIVRRYQEPAQFALQSTVKNGGGQAMFERWLRRFAESKIERLAHCLVIVQKPSSARACFTARRDAGPESGIAEAEWLLMYESAAATPGFAEWLLDSRPVASSNAVLDARHSFAKGQFAPRQFILRADYPFSVTCEVDDVMPRILSLCTGSRTVREIHASAKLEQQMPVEGLAQVVRTLAAGGFVELDGYRPERKR